MSVLTQVTRPAELAESPIWDSRWQSLLCVDINRGRVHRYDPASGEDTVTAVGVPVGAVALRRVAGRRRLLPPGVRCPWTSRERVRAVTELARSAMPAAPAS